MASKPPTSGPVPHPPLPPSLSPEQAKHNAVMEEHVSKALSRLSDLAFVLSRDMNLEYVSQDHVILKPSGTLIVLRPGTGGALLLADTPFTASCVVGNIPLPLPSSSGKQAAFLPILVQTGTATVQLNTPTGSMVPVTVLGLSPRQFESAYQTLVAGGTGSTALQDVAITSGYGTSSTSALFVTGSTAPALQDVAITSGYGTSSGSALFVSSPALQDVSITTGSGTVSASPLYVALTSGSDAIGTVTATSDPTQIANIASGTTIAAGGTVLSTAYTVSGAGTLNVVYAVETATPVQVSYDDGTYYADLAAGSAAAVNALYAYSQPVPDGAVVQFSVPTATTIGIFAAWFQATQ